MRMRFLGIDYGEKRIGVALSDEQGWMAFPFGTLPHDGHIFKKLRALCTAYAVRRVIIGEPLNLQGKETAMTRRVRAFAQKLKKEIDIAIDFENELLSTKAAARIQGKHKKIDAASAALILESYLQRSNQASTS